MNLQRKILNVLNQLGGMLTPVKAIHSHVRLETVPESTLSEVELELKTLESKGQVTGLNSEDYGLRYQITDAGRARLMQ